MQDLADEIGLAITVCHFPPGTSKWNKIEHCMFSFITKTKKGLRVQARLDERDYETGKKISDENMAQLKIILQEVYPLWNYSIEPRTNSKTSRIIE